MKWRVSGKVDAVRLPKQIYFLHRVMQNDEPDIHIIGHWTYPPDTKKTVYVAANHVDAVELFINGTSKGTVPIFASAKMGLSPLGEFKDKSAEPVNGYIYAFKDIAFEPGTIKAVGIKYSSPLPLAGEGQGVRAAADDGEIVCEHELTTAGEPKALKLTTNTGPKGLLADGSDVAFFDFEVVDAQGRHAPPTRPAWISRSQAPLSGAADTIAAFPARSTKSTL